MESRQRLPPELRFTVWEAIIDKAKEERKMCGVGYGRLARYAAVSREWQTVFEPHVFRCLALSKNRVSELAYIIRGKNQIRLRYIQLLQLHVSLKTYHCPDCKTSETAETIRDNNRVFTDAVWTLMSTLAAFNDTVSGSTSGITVELSASSPSDGQHYFRDFRLQAEYPYHTTDDLDESFQAYKRYAEEEAKVSSVAHVTHGDHWLQIAPDAAYERVFGTRPLSFDLGALPPSSTQSEHPQPVRQFPKCSMISSFVIRRQYYRLFDPSAIETLLATSLQSIHTLRLELWRCASLRMLDDFQEDYSRILTRAQLPGGLRNLYLFEDKGYFKRLMFPDAFSLGSPLTLGRSLAEASQGLENLSADSFIDAIHFFGDSVASAPQGQWPQLLTLALSSSLLLDYTPIDMVQGFLCAVADVVRRMPMLQVLEIRGIGLLGPENGACVMRFEPSSSASAVLTFQVLDDVDQWLSPEVVNCWTRMTAERSAHPLIIQKSSVGDINASLSLFDADFPPPYTKLKTVLHPITLYQSQWETRISRER